MERVLGIGGIFFKARDPKRLRAWYRDRLGVDVDEYGMLFKDGGPVQWSPFKQDTQYFDPSRKDFMFNFRVRDLDAMLAQLRAAGEAVDDKVESHEYGRFGWVMDPEGNRVELWQLPDDV